VEGLIEGIKTKKEQRCCRYFLDVLESFRKTFELKKDRRRLYHVGRVMIASLSGIPLREFVSNMLKERVISDNYILAASQLHQFRVDPFMILDYMAHPSISKKALTDFSTNLPRGKVSEVVKLAAKIVGMTDLDKKITLQGLNCFSSDSRVPPGV
jgi:hypothetical protein